MVDAQNERTNGQKRRRGRRRRRGQEPTEVEDRHRAQRLDPEQVTHPAPDSEPPLFAKSPTTDAPVIRPADIAPPTVRSEEYCIHHMASFRENDPMQTRSNMTTLRHLRVDRLGEATLFCDCLHNGPHEWPPSMQRLETAIELDQFLADSTSEA